MEAMRLDLARPPVRHTTEPGQPVESIRSALQDRFHATGEGTFSPENVKWTPVQSVVPARSLPISYYGGVVGSPRLLSPRGASMEQAVTTLHNIGLHCSASDATRADHWRSSRSLNAFYSSDAQSDSAEPARPVATGAVSHIDVNPPGSKPEVSIYADH